MVSSLAGTSVSSATTASAAPRQPCDVRVGDRRRRRAAPVPTRDRAEIARRRARGRTSRRTRCAERRRPGDAALELPAAAADQVIADVRAARVGRLRRATCRARSTLLSATRSWPSPVGTGQFLDRMAVAVAAAEVHPAVDAGRIALQHLLDQADALEELAPVERRDQPQAADQVRHRRLLGRLVLPFGADRVLDGLRRAPRAPRRARCRSATRVGAVFARALQQSRDEGRMHLVRASSSAAPARSRACAARRSACRRCARLGGEDVGRARADARSAPASGRSATPTARRSSAA